MIKRTNYHCFEASHFSTFAPTEAAYGWNGEQERALSVANNPECNGRSTGEYLG
jgi:hypothetical protein